MGRSGIPVSELFPETGKHVDDLCILRSCRHNSPIHAPAEYIATTGTLIGDRPSLGAWVTYGLGSDNQNLPAFMVMTVGETGRAPAGGARFRRGHPELEAAGRSDREPPASAARSSEIAQRHSPAAASGQQRTRSAHPLL
jgi:hypothetical protein